MTDEIEATPPSSPGQASLISHHKPHITWSDSYTKSIHALDSLSAILPSPLPSSLSSSESPATALLHNSQVSASVSSLLHRPTSGSADDPLCAWLYETFHSSPDLHLVVLRFLPALTAAYLSRAALHQPLAGFESVLLAIYSHETTARGGQAITASIPDMAHRSVYHEANKQADQAKNGSTELHLAVISPSLEPHGTVRSTRRARIVGVAMELYYNKIYQIPVESRIEFCHFCKIWSGQDDSDEVNNTEGEDMEETNKEKRRKGRMNMPWELLQPMLRILGHCLMGPEKNEELFQAALVACRCMHARAIRDINPKAIMAMTSLVKLAERANKTNVQVVDHTEITMSNVITI